MSITTPMCCFFFTPTSNLPSCGWALPVHRRSCTVASQVSTTVPRYTQRRRGGVGKGGPASCVMLRLGLGNVRQQERRLGCVAERIWLLSGICEWSHKRCWTLGNVASERHAASLDACRVWARSRGNSRNSRSVPRRGKSVAQQR